MVSHVKQPKREITTCIGRNFAATKMEKRRFPAAQFPIQFSIIYSRQDEELTEQLQTTLKSMFKDRVRYKNENYYNTRFLDVYFNRVADLEELYNECFKDVRLVSRPLDQKDIIHYSKTRLKKESGLILREMKL